MSAGQGRLPRAPGGSPGSMRYEKALQVYASSVRPLRSRVCGPALPSPTSGGPVRAFPESGRPGRAAPLRLSGPFEGLGEVVRERRAHVERLARDGMREREARGVEEL